LIHRSFILGSVLCASLLAGSAAAENPPQVVSPQLLDHIDAVYPPSQLAKGIEATVTLLVLVERDGSVGEVTVAESGGADFDEAALAAVRSWRFAPATRDGAPVRARIRIPFHFAPEAHQAPEAPKVVVGKREQAHEHEAEKMPLPVEFPHGVAAPHAVAEPGKAIEIHVQGRPNPPRRGASDFRIDRSTLDAAPHATAADLLATAPGMHVSHPEGDAIAQRIYLRGFDADHGQDVEFRVGPIPLNLRSHIHGQGYADLNVVIPETVRSLRVIEGIYDPEQGDFAVAGSAYFDLGVEERGLRLTGTYGSFQTARVLALWAPQGQSEETFAAAVVRAGGGFGDGTRGSVSGAASGQMRFELPGHFYGLVHAAGYGGRANIAGVLRRDDVERGVVGFYDAYSDPSARSQSAAATRVQLGLTIEHAEDDGSHQSAAIWAHLTTFRSRLNFTGYTQRSRENPERAGQGDLIEQSNQDAGFGARLTLRGRKLKPLPWLATQLAFGAEVQTDAVDQAQNLLRAPQNKTWDRRVDASIQATSVGLHGDALFGITQYARVRAGLRADLLVFDVDDKLGNFIPAFREETHIVGFRRTAAGIAWGPRASVEGDPTRWLRLSASYGEGYRSPQARQLEEGDVLPFAKVRSYEVGARVAAGERVALTTAVYETRLSYDLAFDATEGRLERIGPTTRRGVVAHLQATPNQWFMASVSGTFVHATLDSPPPATPENPTPAFTSGQQLPFVPPVVVRSDVSFKVPVFSLVGSPVELHLGYATTFLSPRPLPYDQRAAPIFLVDARAALRRTFLEIGVDATNLLNARFADTEYSFVSSWRSTALPSALPTRHLSAGPPLAVLGSVTLFL
jgi:iron complex outermembrane recepter protein